MGDHEKKGFASVNVAKATILIVVLYLMVQVNTADAGGWIVGDEAGWNRDVASWPNGKSFLSGDKLVFRYKAGTHTVAIVNNKTGFDKCDLSSIVQEYKSGNDIVLLTTGDYYFICGIPGHCLDNMKMKITVPPHLD